MSEHKARIEWKLRGNEFVEGRYSREHTWTFDGGVTIAASPSPAVVKPPYSNPEAVDPEEAFVASISSCHMLTFLYLASRAGFVVTSYDDAAVGVMTKNERGIPWISRVALNPIVEYSGTPPSAERERELHHDAHLQCFISNSIRTTVSVAFDDAGSHAASASG